MKKRLLTLPLLTLALVLSGCKTSSESGSSDSSNPSESTGTSESSSSSNTDGTTDPYLAEAEEMLLDFGYLKSASWPSSQIASFLTTNGISESVPTLSTKTPVFYDLYADEDSGAVIFEIAVLDKTTASLDSAYNILESANWIIYDEDEFMFDFDSPLGEIILSGEVYEGDDDFPEATYFYIMVAEGDGGQVDPPADAEEMLLDFGYIKVTSWPSALITSFLSENGVSETVPTLSTKTPFFYDVYSDEDSGAVIFEIAVLDTTAASLNGAYDILEAAGWEIYYEEDIYFDFDSPLGEIILSGEVYEGDEIFPEATYFYITVAGGEDGGDEGGEYESTIGWPESFVNDYLDSYEVTSSVPKLELTGEVLYATFNDDYYFDDVYEYISLFLVDEDVLESYKALLNAAGYTVQDDSEYEDAFQAYDANFELMIDFYYYSDEDIEGTFINIIVYAAEGGNGGGEVTPPTDPENSAVFSFLNDTQISGGKNVDLTTWKSADSTFAVAKTGANENVGNGSYFSNPLRIYGKQTVTITAGGDKLIEQITFTISVINDSGKDSIDTLIELLSESANYTSTPSSVTFAFASPVASVSFQTPRQFRLDSLTLYFVSAE